jgi:hypothetical protein
MRADRKRVTGRRHVDLVPTAIDYALTEHHLERIQTLRGQRYQTGPRYGQELAAASKGMR